VILLSSSPFFVRCRGLIRPVSRIKEPSNLCPTPPWCHSMMYAFCRPLPRRAWSILEAKVLCISLSAWFHYEAISKGSRFDAPSECQVVIRIQFHREDRSLWVFVLSFVNPSNLGCPLPFGIHSSPDEVGFCYPVATNFIKRRVCFERVELVDPSDLPCPLLIRPYLLTCGVL